MCCVSGQHGFQIYVEVRIVSGSRVFLLLAVRFQGVLVVQGSKGRQVAKALMLRVSHDYMCSMWGWIESCLIESSTSGDDDNDTDDYDDTG